MASLLAFACVGEHVDGVVASLVDSGLVGRDKLAFGVAVDAFHTVALTNVEALPGGGHLVMESAPCRPRTID